MSVNWTLEQLDAIGARGSNILVAAAAGSGKTAVLVERIIRMITDTENPVSVDRLLVLTFTDAAASEMRRKISLAIEKKLSENPDDKWLREQSLSVGSACISTIHAFCSRILTNNVHLTNLPADFSLIDDTENQVLRSQALDSVLEAYYSRIDKKDGFRELVLGWGGIKGDDSLREIILDLHNFSRSLAYPKKWLHNAWREDYSKIAENKSLVNTARETLLSSKLYKCARNIYDGLDIIRNIVDAEVPQDHAYFTYYFDMADSFCNAFNKLSQPYSLDELTLLLNSLEIKSAPRKTGLDDSTASRITKIRDASVKAEKKKAEEFISALSTENILRTSKCASVVKTLCSIVRQTERVHQRYKRERSAIDFSDLEHGLLQLLVNNRGEETDLCLKLRDYYHEILLDEFQDTNTLQFEIFSRLSKEAGNLFMVGDVKQCIYKFRNADPSIFMRLYTDYDMGKDGQLIRLFKNFRSRPEVIDSVNYIFSSVMNEKLGGVNYTEDEYLINGASYPDGNYYETEIMVTDTANIKSTDPTLADFETIELEAKHTAARIREIICGDGLKVTDSETGLLRDATYGDITILCRGAKECAVIEEELLRMGISALSESGRQYLESLEVDTVLSFLRIIDNPLQDIPLIAVMRSGLFKFTADELANIRAATKGRFYDALCVAAENNKKAADFLAILLELRNSAKYMGVDELVWKICKELHYSSIVGAMPNGDLREANLKLLLERCSDFEQGSLHGLFNFIKYIEMLKETGKDLAPVRDSSHSDNSVKIMTMHKSKGLEFPVVVLFGTIKKFYLGDIQKNIIWDEKLGIGLDYVDTRQRVKFSSPIRKMIEDELLSSSKSEEMRLLYVAMTRAKEKLIISTAITQRDNKWTEAEFSQNGSLYPVLADRIMCMRDWVLSALMNSPYADSLRDYADRADIKIRKSPVAGFSVYFSEVMDNISDMQALADSDDNEGLSAPDMAERLDYSYPHSSLKNLPIKLSVSELKRRTMPSEDFSTGLLKEPSSLTGTASDFKASERGTITHFVLQHIDFARTNSQDEILSQIEDLVSSGVISKAQSSVVDVASISKFFESDIGKRLKGAGRFEREFDFYMLVPPEEVTSNITSSAADDVILQGIADCLFFEPDGIVLIDYKTDRVDKGSVHKRSEHYRMQIELYARAISEIFDIPVKEKYLYFLNCDEAVIVN